MTNNWKMKRNQRWWLKENTQEHLQFAGEWCGCTRVRLNHMKFDNVKLFDCFAYPTIHVCVWCMPIYWNESRLQFISKMKRTERALHSLLLLRWISVALRAPNTLRCVCTQVHTLFGKFIELNSIVNFNASSTVSHAHIGFLKHTNTPTHASHQTDK